MTENETATCYALGGLTLIDDNSYTETDESLVIAEELTTTGDEIILASKAMLEGLWLGQEVPNDYSLICYCATNAVAVDTDKLTMIYSGSKGYIDCILRDRPSAQEWKTNNIIGGNDDAANE